MIRSITLLCILLLPGISNALGLGKFELQSNLNQPLEARIDLLSVTADELDSLKVNLAGSEDFAKAKIDRPFSLTKLKFDINETTSGSDYIRIYSTEPIREPFLNFLIEINWNRGRLLREYTALLDPPTYAPNVSSRPVVEPSMVAPGPVIEDTPQPVVESPEVSRPAPAPVVPSSSPVVRPGSGIDYPVNAIGQSGHNVVYNPNYTPAPVSNQPAPRQQTAAAPTPQYTGSDHTTQRGDTLWALAAQMRPDTSVSVQQTMMAMFRANPEAFLDNNINQLKTGQLLSNPSLEDIRSQSNADAIAQVAEHNNLWSGFKQALAETAEERPDSPGDTLSESPQMEAVTESSAEADPELRLLGSSDSDAGVGQGTTEQGADSAMTGEDSALMQESLLAMESENKELQDKLLEAESLIEDLNRLIVLKEDELAALKNQLGEAAEMPMEEMPVEDMVDEPLPAEEFDLEDTMEETVEQAVDDAEALMEMEDESMVEQMEETEETLGEMLPEEPTAFIEEQELPEIDAEQEYGELYDESAMDEEFPGQEPLPMEETESDFDEPEFDDASEDMVADSQADALPDEPSADVTATTTSSESDSGLGAVSGILDTVQQYFGSFIEFAQQNIKMLGSVLGGLLVLLLGYFGYNKFRGEKAEVLELDDDDDILDFGEDDTAEATEQPAEETDLSDSTMVLDEPVDLAAVEETAEPSDEMQSTAALDLTDSATPGFAEPQGPGDADDDPLAEVNVFLAYEHFDQAEDFVRKAIDENPDNLDFHTKLLEVYYAAGDKPAYEAAAKVLHEKVGGSGEHWDMTQAMWSEMSPNRNLFEDRADGLDDTQALAPGSAEDALNSGMLDLTATEETGFTAGGVGIEETASDILDITGQHPAASATEVNEPEDLLDTFSEANGLETIQDENILDVSGAMTDSDVLDISGGHQIGEGTDNILDLTGGDSAEDILDITAGSQEDLLDVTASTDLDSLPSMTNAEDIKEESTLDFDVQGLDLDMPDATSSGSDKTDRMSDTIERAMELSEQSKSEPAPANDSTLEDSAVLDFDLPVPGADDAPAELDLDISGAHDVSAEAKDETDFSSAITVELDESTSSELSEQAKSTLENAKTVEMPKQDISNLKAESESSLDVELSDEITVDMDTVGADTDDLKADLGDTNESTAVDLDLTNEFTLDEENTDSMSQDFDLELQDDDDDDELIPNTELDIDMDGTVEMPDIPKIDYMDDEDDKTVFIPRSSSSEEQSLEDEISTKLDLAKAYVELGDNDSAKTILDEIVAEGNPEQKQVAQELLTQVS